MAPNPIFTNEVSFTNDCVGSTRILYLTSAATWLYADLLVDVLLHCASAHLGHQSCPYNHVQCACYNFFT